MRNLPNILSISRLFATILVFILILINQPWAFLLATILFVLASITDYLDGYLARRMKVVSSLGVFLDLTADKVLVAAVLIAFSQLNLISAWITFIIITREFLVSGLRSVAASKGKVIPAGIWGKQKTFITMVAMGVLLLAKGLGAQGSDLLLLVANILMILAAVWTALSGIEYAYGARSLFFSKDEAEIQR